MTIDPNRSASRLPREPEYWDRLATHVVQEATSGTPDREAPGSDTLGNDTPSYDTPSYDTLGKDLADVWWAPIAAFSPALVATAVLAILGAWVWVERAPGVLPVEATGPARVLERALSPSDPGLTRLLNQSSPPPAVHLLTFAPVQERE